jgi:hypothetical protein
LSKIINQINKLAQLTANPCRQNQPVNDFATFEVRFNDFVNISIVHKTVPNALWIHHRHRAAGTAVKATRFVHANLAFATQISLFDQHFAAVKAFLGMVLGAAVFAVFALIRAKKDVAFVI